MGVVEKRSAKSGANGSRHRKNRSVDNVSRTASKVAVGDQGVSEVDVEIWRDAVLRDWTQLASAPDEIREDPAVVTDAVRRSWRALEHASESLRNDRAVVLQAIGETWWALELASEELQGDPSVVSKACEQSVWALQFATHALRADRDWMLKEIRRHGEAIRFASEELRADPELARVAVLSSGPAFVFLDETLHANEELVLAALAHSPMALSLAPPEFQGDRELVFFAVHKEGLALEHASEELRADRDILLMAVRQNGDALGFASEELRDDAELVLEAVQQRGEAIRFASDDLRDNTELVLEAVRQSGRALAHASVELRRQGFVVLEAVKQSWESVVPALAIGPEAMREAIRQNWRAIEHVLWKMRPKFEVDHGFREAAVEPRALGDDELAELATWNPRIVQAPALRRNRAAVYAAVQQNGLLLQHAVPELQDDRELVAAAVRQRVEALVYASPDLQEDEDILTIAIGQRRRAGLTVDRLRPRGPSKAEAFLRRVEAVPWNPLGRRQASGGEQQEAPEPDGTTVAVDLVEDYPVIRDKGPHFVYSRYGGFAAMLYEWLGIHNEEEYPDDVKAKINEELEAKFQIYGSKAVVHVGCPKLERSSLKAWCKALAKAYHSILEEFADSGLQRLRLPPVTGGPSGGRFAEWLPQITAEALNCGFSQLLVRQQDALIAATVELCCNAGTEEELEAFAEGLREEISLEVEHEQLLAGVEEEMCANKEKLVAETAAVAQKRLEAEKISIARAAEEKVREERQEQERVKRNFEAEVARTRRERDEAAEWVQKKQAQVTQARKRMTDAVVAGDEEDLTPEAIEAKEKKLNRIKEELAASVKDLSALEEKLQEQEEQLEVERSEQLKVQQELAAERSRIYVEIERMRLEGKDVEERIRKVEEEHEFAEAEKAAVELSRNRVPLEALKAKERELAAIKPKELKLAPSLSAALTARKRELAKLRRAAEARERGRATPVVDSLPPQPVIAAPPAARRSGASPVGR